LQIEDCRFQIENRTFRRRGLKSKIYNLQSEITLATSF
jgi:hypothetical protein